MRFKNLKTGNIVCTENPVAIELMKTSDNYEAVPDVAKQNKKTPLQDGENK